MKKIKIGQIYYSEITDIIVVIDNMSQSIRFNNGYIEYTESGFFKTVGSGNFDDYESFVDDLKKLKYKLIGEI